MELLAKGIEAVKATELRGWEGRGGKFLAELCRGRYAASDAVIESAFQQIGVSASATKPIIITLAIKKLAEKAYYPSTIEAYDFLSNICQRELISEYDEIELPLSNPRCRPMNRTAVQSGAN